MSHITKIEIEVKDLGALKAACSRMGFRFVAHQKTYAWYGSFMGDAPLPEGLTEEDLGKCDHAIQVPGASYEIGVRAGKGGYRLLWDSWTDGGLEERVGVDASRLKQAYGVELARREARRKGFSVTEIKNPDGSILLDIRVDAKRIKVSFNPDGQLTLKTIGFIGKECQEASRFLEKALGSRIRQTLTSEFYQAGQRLEQKREGV